MQPAIRKLKILEAIVDSYIGTGEPVGSKTLCDGLDFNVSSATIRNDMSCSHSLIHLRAECQQISVIEFM